MSDGGRDSKPDDSGFHFATKSVPPRQHILSIFKNQIQKYKIMIQKNIIVFQFSSVMPSGNHDRFIPIFYKPGPGYSGFRIHQPLVPGIPGSNKTHIRTGIHDPGFYEHAADLSLNPLLFLVFILIILPFYLTLEISISYKFS